MDSRQRGTDGLRALDLAEARRAASPTSSRSSRTSRGRRRRRVPFPPTGSRERRLPGRDRRARRRRRRGTLLSDYVFFGAGPRRVRVHRDRAPGARDQLARFELGLAQILLRRAGGRGVRLARCSRALLAALVVAVAAAADSTDPKVELVEGRSGVRARSRSASSDLGAAWTGWSEDADVAQDPGLPREPAEQLRPRRSPGTPSRCSTSQSASGSRSTRTSSCLKSPQQVSRSSSSGSCCRRRSSDCLRYDLLKSGAARRVTIARCRRRAPGRQGRRPLDALPHRRCP